MTNIIAQRDSSLLYINAVNKENRSIFASTNRVIIHVRFIDRRQISKNTEGSTQGTL